MKKTNCGPCVVCKEGTTEWRAYGHFAHPACCEMVIRLVLVTNELTAAIMSQPTRKENDPPVVTAGGRGRGEAGGRLHFVHLDFTIDVPATQ